MCRRTIKINKLKMMFGVENDAASNNKEMRQIAISTVLSHSADVEARWKAISHWPLNFEQHMPNGKWRSKRNDKRDKTEWTAWHCPLLNSLRTTWRAGAIRTRMPNGISISVSFCAKPIRVELWMLLNTRQLSTPTLSTAPRASLEIFPALRFRDYFQTRDNSPLIVS